MVFALHALALRLSLRCRLVVVVALHAGAELRARGGRQLVALVVQAFAAVHRVLQVPMDPAGRVPPGCGVPVLQPSAAVRLVPQVALAVDAPVAVVLASAPVGVVESVLAVAAAVVVLPAALPRRDLRSGFGRQMPTGTVRALAPGHVRPGSLR
jgi:hypothetical protein